MRTSILSSTLLVLFLSIFSDVHVEACATPVCYEDIPRHFAFNPGDYLPTAMTPDLCKQKCSLYRMPYAALAGGSYCFCGNTLPLASKISAGNCNTACSGNTGLTECGGLRHVNVYCVTPPPEDVQVNMPQVVEVLQENTINITTLKESTGYTYQLDTGEGNGLEIVASNVVEKAFSVSGEHIVTATVLDSSGLAPNSSGSASIYAQVPVEKVDLKCPEVWVATEEMTCNATVLSGTLMTVDVDYKDSQPRDNFPIADATWFAAGTGVMTAAAAAADVNKVYVRHHSDFMGSGTLVAFEYYAQATGTVNFLILRPSCANGNVYCHGTNDCPATCTSTSQATCSAGDVFCGFSAKCTVNTLPASSCGGPVVRHSATPAANLQYTVTKLISHTITATGYGSLKIDPDITLVEVLPGDVVGYFSGAAVLGKSTDGPNDFTVNAITSTAEANVVSAFTDAGHRVMLRAIATKPSTVMFYHTYDQPGQYDIALNVTNDLLAGKFVTVFKTVYIEEGINSTVISNPEYGVTNEVSQFEVLPHTGSNLTYEWNFGEGPYLNVTQAGRYFNYTYRTRGQYNVTVRVYNRLLSRNNDSSIIIEDRITNMGLFGTHAATGKPYSITFNMTSGSDYTCTWSWGDGTTFQTNWTALPPTGSVQTHNFPAERWYTVSVTCRNNVSSGTISKDVMSLDPPINITLIKTGAIKATTFKIQWKIDKGTNTTWNLTLDNTSYPIIWNEATKMGETRDFLNGLPVGRYLLKLHGENLVDFEQLIKNFTVDNPIQGLTYNPKTLQEVLVGQPVIFTTDMTGGSSVILSIDYKDGLGIDLFDTTNGGNVLIDWPGTKSFTHHFNRPGSFNVTAIVRNNFNFSQFHTMVDVYNKVENLTLQPKSPIPYLNNRAHVQFWYETPTFPPTKAIIEWSWGNGDANLKDDPFQPLGTKKTKYYLQTGNYFISTNVSNKISWAIFNTSIHILRPVVSMELKVEPPHAVVNTPVTLMVAMESGDDVTIYYDTGVTGAAIAQNPRTKTSPYQWDTLTTTYTTPGKYTIKVTAANALGNTTKMYEIYVQDPVKPTFVLTSNFPVEFIAGMATVTYTLTYPASDTLPSNPSIILDHGDNKDTYPPAQTLTIPGTRIMTFTHTYTTPGDYTTNFTIFNLASKQTFTVQSGVYERISGVSCSALQQQLIPHGSPDVPGYGTNKLTFPLHNPLKLHFTVTKGTISKYKVNTQITAPGTDHESPNQPVAVTLTQAGDYTVTCQAWNPINSESVTLNVKMAAGIQGITVTNRQVIRPEVETTFAVGVSSIGTDSCMIVDFGEKDGTKVYYGTATGCTGRLPSGSTISGQILSSMQLKYTYKTTETYEVTLNGYTDSIQVTNSSKLTVTVTKQNCLSPLITLMPNSPRFYEPHTFERNSYIKLEAKNTIECQETMGNTKLWRVFSVSSTTGNDIKEIDISSVTTKATANLVLNPRFLQYGVYRLNFKMAMKTSNQEFPAEENTYIKVVPPALVVALTDGGMSIIKRGWNRTITLSPKKFSFDPGVEPTAAQGLSFECFCRRLDETFTKYRNGTLISMGASAFMTSAQLDADTSPDKGGCARRGPGVLNLTDHGEFSFNSSNMRVNESYEFQCRVWKDTRETLAKLVIYVVEGDPPAIVQRCVGENQALCRPFPGGHMINPNNRMALKAYCIMNCGDGAPLKYQWSVERRRINGDWVETNVTAYAQGTTSSQIAFPTILFMSDYAMYGEYMDYRVKVLVSVPGNKVLGESLVVLDMNKPPQPGTCTLDKTAYNVGEKATFTCAGWTDSEGVDGAVVHAGIAGKISALTFLDDGKMHVTLPFGNGNNVLVKCLVKDKYGAVTTFNMTHVSVTMDAATESAIIANLQKIATNMDLLLKKAAEEGDTASILAQVEQILTQANAVSDTKLASLKSILDAENAKLEAGLKDPNLTEAQKNALIQARDEAAKQYQALRDTISQCKEKCLLAIASLETDTPEGLLAIANVMDSMDDPGQMTLVSQKTMLKKGMDLASGLQKNADNLPREDVESIGAAALQGILTGLHSTQSIMSNPTNTEYTLSKLSYNYIFDADWESLQEDFAPDDFKGLQKATIKIDASLQAKATMAPAIQSLQTVSLACLRTLVNGESPINIKVCEGPALSQFIAKKESFSKLTKPVTQQGVTYLLPANLIRPKILPDNSTEDPVLGVGSMTMLRNPIPTVSQGERVTCTTLDLTVTDENGTLQEFNNLAPPLDIFFPIDASKSTVYVQTPKLPVYKKNGPRRFFWYHSVDCLQYEGVRVRIQPNVTGTRYLVVVDKNKFPNCTLDANCNTIDWLVLPRTNGTPGSDPYMALFNNNQMGNGKYKAIVGVRQLDGDELAAYLSNTSRIPQFTTPQHEVFTTTYLSEFTCMGVFYFNPKTVEAGWNGEGLTVGPKTVPTLIHLQSKHLSLFGAGFAVQPNKIDWAFVFSNMDFFKNPTLYIVEILTCIIFILALIWARYKDKKDKLKLGVSPLPDNEADDKYLYEILVYTGMRTNAGTESKVNFIISGEYDETDVRTFEDPERKIFKRGAVDSFLMATAHPLGALNYIRVWHDNKGKGKYGSWYLKYVIVTDLQTLEKYFFICNRWLAAEEDDGLVDRLLAVAGKEQMTDFSHLFSHSTKKKLDDDHLWFSVVARPPQSRFTRVQRVCCCLLLLYTTMLADAVFYETAASNSGKKVFSVGPFALTPQQFYVGIIANLIVFPINFLVVFLFRKSRPKNKRPSRIAEALKRMKEQKAQQVSNSDLKAQTQFDDDHGKDPDDHPISAISRPSFSQSYRSRSSIPFDPEQPPEPSQSEEAPKEEVKKKFSLPWWCVIIAWALLIVSVMISVAFVTFFGIMFGDTKSKKWLTSMLVAFFTSVFFTQPIQVLVVAALLSLIFKDPSLADDDGEEDEEEIELGNDEEYLHQLPQEGYARPRKIAYKPPDPQVLEKARQQRLSEKEMYAVMREIIFYFIFLWMLLVISYSFRDPNAFLIKQSFVKNFILRDNGDPAVNFKSMKTTKQFFDWAENTLVPQLRADKWYNGQWLPGQRGFIHDRNNRIMGYATIRQLRVKPAKCNLVKPMDKVLRECNVPYAFYNEDRDTKGVGWTMLESNSTWNNSAEEYVHRSASDLESFPYWAVHHVYGGGGYVRELRGSVRKLTEHIKALHDGGWFDHYTRAVFIEFTVYNAQVNIFTICTLSVEFLPTGSIFPSYRFEPVNLLGYSMDTAGFEIICQIIYMIYILFFIISEARELYKKRSAYFTSWWNWVEMMIIFLSLSGAVIFFYRLTMANKLTNKFKESGGNAYMKFQYLGYWNELLMYMIGWLVFLATVKFLRLLRFNRRMSMLASTLRNCAKSLVNFALVFLIVFFAYVQFFYLVFFITINEFSTFLVASETCLQMILGRFNFFEMKGASPTLGPLFFLAYVISVALILINMFVTILNEGFADVRDDLTKQMNDYEIVDFFVKRLKSWTGVGAVVHANKSQAEQDEYAIQMATLDAMAKATEDNSYDFNPNYKNKAEEMENFPDKVDRLVRYIGNMYFPNKEWLEAIAIKKMEEKRKSHDRGPDYGRF